MKIVADSDIPFIRGVIEPYADVVYLRGDEIKPADAAGADALLIRTRTLCDRDLLEGSKVKFIGTATIGSDHIDTKYCVAHGIAVSTAKGSNARGVLQWVAASLVWLAANRGMQPGRTTLGIIGIGDIGSLVKKYASEWGYRVMCSDPPREQAEGLSECDGFYPLSEVATGSDIITFHTPLTCSGRDATFHMADEGFFSLAKPDAVIINSSRGPVIEPKALQKASVRRGFIIDTWNGEPGIDRETLRRVLLGTPHIAGYSLQGKAAATAMIVDALAAEFGLPLRGWFPDEKLRGRPRPVSWDELRATIPSYCDISKESAALKAHPERFEDFRNGYRYREEYF